MGEIADADLDRLLAEIGAAVPAPR